MPSTFEQELAALINKHSIENFSNTPDYVLASYLNNCLKTFGEAMIYRDHWYGKKKELCQAPTISIT